MRGVCKNIDDALNQLKKSIGIESEGSEPRGEIKLPLPKLRIFPDKKISLAE